MGDRGLPGHVAGPGNLGPRLQPGDRPPGHGDVPRPSSPLRRADLDARRHAHLLPGRLLPAAACPPPARSRDGRGELPGLGDGPGPGDCAWRSWTFPRGGSSPTAGTTPSTWSTAAWTCWTACPIPTRTWTASGSRHASSMPRARKSQRRALDQPAARRSEIKARRSAPRPRIGLDPYGVGVQVILPAVGDTPDGVATWRVTADGDPVMVRSRAQWVGSAEAAPQTVHPLTRPVRDRPGLAGRLGSRERAGCRPALGPDPVLRRRRQASPGAAAPAPGPSLDPAPRRP